MTPPLHLSELPKESDVLEALKQIKDPEIGLNIVDLGLIYKVNFEGRVVHIFFTVTSPRCPITQILGESIERAMHVFSGLEGSMAHLVFDPPWSPEKISEAGKKQLSIS